MKNKQKQNEERNKDGLTFRDCVFEIREINEEGKEPVKGLYMSASSEEPVLTYARYNGEYQRVYEILDHSPSSVNMSRMKDGLIIQDTHWGDQIGLIRKVSLDGKKLGGIAEFCCGERAQEIAQDAMKGLRRNTSVGYICNPESYKLDGEKDGIPVVRCTDWTPYEVSFVNVPADTSVGVGRELNIKQSPSNDEGKRKEEVIMNPKQMAELAKRANENGVSDKLAGIMETAETFEAAERALNDAIIVSQRAQIQSLKVVAPAKVDPVAQRTVAPVIDVPNKEMRQYSVMKALRAIGGDKSVDAGFEREVSEELAKQRGKSASGIIVPFSALGRRAFTVAGTSSASVSTDLMANDFIDLLRTQSVLGAAGVRFMTGLVGNVAIPKMTAGATGYWVAEAGDITGSQPTMGQVTGTPHTCGVLVDISRKLLQQSTPSAEMLVRDEIMERIIRTIQIATFAGTGADGQPSAITNATGINDVSVTTGTPTYAELLGFIGAIMADNAMADNQKWIGTGEVWAKLAATATNGAGSPLALDAATNKLIGRDFLTTEDVPANSLWFGNWNTVTVGVWGNGLDITADTATLSSSGGLRLVGLQDVDIMVRNGQALAYDLAVTS
jgi:HK97 family phage major capsid protein